MLPWTYSGRTATGSCSHSPVTKPPSRAQRAWRATAEEGGGRRFTLLARREWWWWAPLKLEKGEAEGEWKVTANKATKHPARRALRTAGLARTEVMVPVGVVGWV